MTVQLNQLAHQLCILKRTPGGNHDDPRNLRAADANNSIGDASLPGQIHLARGMYGPMLTFDADSVIGQSLRTSGTFQESKIAEVSQFLAKKHNFRPETFFDIGANIGTHLVYALKEARYLEGFGVEPDVNNYRLLVCNVLLNGLEGRTSLFNLALSDDAGWAELELSTENFGDHRIRSAVDKHAVTFGENGRKTYQVPMMHAGRWIDDVARDPKGTLIWVDTQGHEGHVFRCFLGDQAYVAPQYMVAEFWPYGLERSGGKNAYLEYLAQCDAVYDINAENWAQSSPVSVDSLTARYDKMLAETTAVHYPHTDLLCICVG